MKIVTLISRLLLGLVFVVFGLNGFLQFIPAPPPTGKAGDFFAVMFTSHYLVPVFVLQLAGGLLLLLNRFVPVALCLLGPVLVNILIYHVLLNQQGLPIAAIVAVLWGVVFYAVRGAFAGIFQAPGKA